MNFYLSGGGGGGVPKKKNNFGGGGAKCNLCPLPPLPAPMYERRTGKCNNLTLTGLGYITTPNMMGGGGSGPQDMHEKLCREEYFNAILV